MEYPGTKFTKKYRQLLLALAVILFCLTAPLVVMYAMGYRYDWQYGILRQTGSLSVDVEPNDGDVYLDNIKLSKGRINKRVKLTDIKPGRYQLLIKTEGYLNWEKEIEIYNNETTYIKDVNLLRKDKEIELFSKKIRRLLISPSGKYLSYLDQNNYISLYNLDTEQEEKLINLKNEDVIIEWGQKNDCFYLAMKKMQIYSDVKIVCPNISNDIKTLPTTSTTKIHWHNENEPILYYSDLNNIQSFNIKNNRNQIISVNNFVDWYMSGNNLWALEFNTNTLLFDLIEDVKGFTKNNTSIKINNSTINNSSSLKLLRVTNEEVLLEDNINNETILISGQQKKIKSNHYYISPYYDWWLLWSDTELWTHEKKSSLVLASRSGQKLKDVLIMDEFNTLGLVRDDKLTILYPYYLVNIDLIKENVDTVVADHEKRIIYYTIKDKEGLFKLNY